MIFLINLIKSLLLVFRYIYIIHLNNYLFFISLEMSFFANTVLKIQLLIFNCLFCGFFDELIGDIDNVFEFLKVFDLYLINCYCIFSINLLKG